MGEEKMNYLKHYMLLIKKRRKNVLKNGEKHHIIPKSISNTTFIFEKLNEPIGETIMLTLREHYIAHLLLVKICENNKNCYEKMLYAFNMMNSRCNNSFDYNIFKQKFLILLSSKLKGKPSRAKGYKWSDEYKQSRIDNHYMKGKTYEEIYGKKQALKLKQDKSNLHKGKIVSNSTRKKLSNRIFTKEWKQKLSKAHKGKNISEETKKKISSFMSNPDKNPNVDQTLFLFTHDIYGDIIARKYDMKKIYDCKTIHKVIKGDRKHSNGWKFIKKVDKNEH